MGQLGQTEAGAHFTARTGKNAPAAYRHFDRSLTRADSEAIRREIIIGGVVGVICALAFVGWALTTL